MLVDSKFVIDESGTDFETDFVNLENNKFNVVF